MEPEAPNSQWQSGPGSVQSARDAGVWESEESSLSHEESRLLDWLDQLEDREPYISPEARGSESWNEWKNELRRRACQMALAPAQSLTESARAAIASLALQQKKRVRLNLLDPQTASELCMDAASHEVFRSALVHLLRNAVTHGIEAPVERQALGKSQEGLIQLGIEWRNGVLQVLLGDDGRGLQEDRIRASAAAAGVSDSDALSIEELIFHPRVSSRHADGHDEWAGTAVGLDAVRSSLQAQMGDISVISGGGSGRGLELALCLKPKRLALAVYRLILTSPEGVQRSIYVPESVVRKELSFQDAQLATRLPGWITRQADAWYAFERFTRGPVGAAQETPESLVAPFLREGARAAWAEENPDFRIFRRAERAWAARIPKGAPGFLHQLGLAPLLG